MGEGSGKSPAEGQERRECNGEEKKNKTRRKKCAKKKEPGRFVRGQGTRLIRPPPQGASKKTVHLNFKILRGIPFQNRTARQCDEVFFSKKRKLLYRSPRRKS